MPHQKRAFFDAAGPPPPPLSVVSSDSDGDSLNESDMLGSSESDTSSGSDITTDAEEDQLADDEAGDDLSELPSFVNPAHIMPPPNHVPYPQEKHVYPSRYQYAPGPYIRYADDPFTNTRFIDPFEFRTEAAERLTHIPFTRFTFDGTNSFTPSPVVFNELRPPVEYDAEHFTPPFNGVYDSNFLAVARLRAQEFLSSLIKDIRQECDLQPDAHIGDSDQLLRFPPSIYFARQANYPYRVCRSRDDPATRLPHMRSRRAAAVALIQSVHAVLKPDQAAEASRDDIDIMVVDGNLCVPATIHRGEFFQQLAPSANPYFSLSEVGYLRTAVGFFRFYGEDHTACILDEILITPCIDEDLVATLLVHYHLDNLAGTHLVPNWSLTQIFDNARRTREEQHRFYAEPVVGLANQLLKPPLAASSLLDYYGPAPLYPFEESTIA